MGVPTTMVDDNEVTLPRRLSVTWPLSPPALTCSGHHLASVAGTAFSPKGAQRVPRLAEASLRRHTRAHALGQLVPGVNVCFPRHLPGRSAGGNPFARDWDTGQLVLESNASTNRVLQCQHRHTPDLQVQRQPQSVADGFAGGVRRVRFFRRHRTGFNHLRWCGRSG